MKFKERYYVFRKTELGYLERDPLYSKYGYSSEEEVLELIAVRGAANIEYSILHSVEGEEEE
jgi:hypothetical protein